jgi:hypothetical protein
MTTKGEQCLRHSDDRSSSYSSDRRSKKIDSDDSESVGEKQHKSPGRKEKSKKERLLNLNTERREENQEAEERAVGEQTSLSFWPVKS